MCALQSQQNTLSPDILTCHGYGGTQGAVGQAVVFGCIDYWSTYCPAMETTSGMSTYDVALAKFATCTAADTGNGYTVNYQRQGWNQQSGYCHGSLHSAAILSNQGACNMGSNVDIGFHIRIPFHTNIAGSYTFRFHADYGLGSFIGVDGAEHTPGNTWGHLQTDPAQLSAGDHEFESLGFEDCCDGHSELEVHLPCDRPTGVWRVVTAGSSSCMTCTPPPSQTCASQTSSAGQCGTTGQAGGA